MIWPLFKFLGQKLSKFSVGILVETMTPKGHFEINWPLVQFQKYFVKTLSTKLWTILQKELHPISISDAEHIFKLESLADVEISKINIGTLRDLISVHFNFPTPTLLLRKWPTHAKLLVWSQNVRIMKQLSTPLIFWPELYNIKMFLQKIKHPIVSYKLTPSL